MRKDQGGGLKLLALCAFVTICATFEWVSLYFGYKRYLVSAEMLLAVIFVVGGRPWAGLVVFMMAVVLETLLGTITILRLIDAIQVWDIAEYLLDARRSYLVLLIAIFVLVSVFFWVGSKGLRWVRLKWLLLFALVLLTFQWYLSFAKASFFSPSFAEQNELLFGSTTLFVHSALEENRRKHLHIGAYSDDAEYVPISEPSAARVALGEKITSQRVLLVIAESWGLTKDPASINQQIQPIRRSTHVRDVSFFDIEAVGTTAAGELRELCGRVPTRLNFRGMTKAAVGVCLPAQLAELGYKTVSLHAAFGTMYQRVQWYPILGFGESLFREDLPFSGAQCYSFPGYCDRDMFDLVRRKMQKGKVFFYWLTLNSHVPYDRRDVANFRPNLCHAAFGSNSSEQLCNYQNLHAQFFEGLASLVEDPSMKGVEVLVVGDHPPIFYDSKTRELFSRDRVPVLHFVVN